jgi:hypothetical protein
MHEMYKKSAYIYVKIKGSSSPTEVPSNGIPITGPGTP